MGSCGWQEAETVVPTMGCQDSVKFNSSGSILSAHQTSEKFSDGDRQRGGTEEERGPRPGFDCTGGSDKVTGKGRLGQGIQGEPAGATVTPGRAHSSLRSPATPVEATISFSHAAEWGIGHKSFRLDSM